jgi:hypothetical protein
MAPPNQRATKPLVPHLLPDGAYDPIASVIESGAWKNGQLQQIENALCIGTSARLSIKRTFTYRPPDTAGIPLDEANDWRISHLQGARNFLKREFFYYSGQSFNGVSQPDDMDQPLDNDQLDVVDRDAFDHRNFVNGAQLLQRTYAARFLKTLYFHEGGYADMQLLFQMFTFRIPYDVIVKFEKIDPTPHIKLPADNHYFGYDGEKFSPQLAIEYQDFLWRWIAKNLTSIAEASVENGQTRFSIEMSMEMFCKYAVPVEDLRSR